MVEEGRGPVYGLGAGRGQLEDLLDLGQHHLGDQRQVEIPRLLQGQPGEVAELPGRAAQVLDIAGQRGGVGEEETRVEPLGAVGRGDRAEEGKKLICKVPAPSEA